MKYSNCFKIIRELEFDVKRSVYKKDNTEIYLIRPSNSFKGYDINKNFQIFLKENDRYFRPNHLRVFIDLHLRARSRPDLKNELLLAFDKIFNKENPIVAIRKIEQEKFEHFLNPLRVIAKLSQLFLIEQEYNYIGKSNYNPVTLFYQGWVRQFIDSSKEIDNLVYSVCNRQPPAAKYTFQENKKHKKYNTKNKELWYLD